MSLTGEPDPTYFRTFVQARHVFSFVTIGELGWSGDWRGLVTQTMDLLIRRARRSDGFFVHRLDASGNPIDGRADLYDQAFILFALGTAGGALGRSDWIDVAEDLLDRIEGAWTHPAGGFREGEIVSALPRRQNPHMHLLEAFLALSEASGRERFARAAQLVAIIATSRFLDADSGALLEYFTDDLRPAPGVDGRIAEPGHCFEWAWLIERIAETGFAEGLSISDRLVEFARGSGIDEARDVAINEVLIDGSVHDPFARLWPQTERLKAAAIRYRLRGGSGEAAEAAAAFAGLRNYWDVSESGLWRDKLKPDGGWVEELAPGSSLYHISCAIAELSLASQPNPG
jgi:mannose-6-phosphate isomerase